MKYFNKTISILTVITLLCLSFTIASFAVGKSEVSEKLYNNRGGIASIAHFGDTAAFPANSLEGIESAVKKGADMISVSVRKTLDGVFVLLDTAELSSLCSTEKKDIGEISFKEAKELHLLSSDKTVSSCKIASLEEAIKAVSPKAVLIVDNGWEYREELCEFISQIGAEESVMLRTFESAKKILSFKEESKTKVGIIGIYDGNIVFNAISHLNRLSEAGEALTQYQSKNYFNIMYQNFTASRYSAEGKARAIAPVYDKDLCGQREDSITGWDDLISRGFSVIETNCIEELTAYIKQCDSCAEQLSSLSQRATKIDTSLFSSVSVKNFEAAASQAQTCLDNNNTSLGKMQTALSSLDNAMNSLKNKTEGDSQKGSLNVTAGKVAAIIIFGLLILAGQIYAHKMQKKKK